VGKKGRGRRGKRPWIDYEARGRHLLALGFATYADYLASPLWASIRQKVLDRDRGQCRLCPKPATQVHHARYDRETLEGTSLTFLGAVCAGCHRFVEFDAQGKKKTAAAVGQAFRRARRRRSATVWAERTDPLIAEFKAIIRDYPDIPNPPMPAAWLAFALGETA